VTAGSAPKNRHPGGSDPHDVDSCVEIRPGGPDDVAALARLRREWRLERHGIALDADSTFEDRFGAWYADQLDRGSRVWLAYHDDAPIGMLPASAWCFATPDDRA